MSCQWGRFPPARRVTRAAMGTLVFTLALLLAPAALLHAQEGAAGKSGQDTKSYVLPYTIVVLAVGLGVFIVCRPTHRAEAERQDYFGATPKGMRGEDFHRTE